MAKRGTGHIKKAVIAGVAVTSAFGVGLTPTLANAETATQTYYIGFPDGLAVPGQSLGADPAAIANALMANHNSASPYVGWSWLLPNASGTTPVDLTPDWRTGTNNNFVFAATGAESCSSSSNGPGHSSSHCVTPGTFTGGTWGQWYIPNALAEQAMFANWTTYANSVTLIAYGDSAIATGQAYQAYLDVVRDGTLQLGAAQTDDRAGSWNRVDVQQVVIGEVVHDVETWSYSDSDGTMTTIVHQSVSSNYTPTYPTAPTVPSDPDSVTPAGVLNLMLISLAFLRNPTRPGGGLYARFAPLYEELTGTNPVTPAPEDILPAGVDRDVVVAILTGNTDGLTAAQITALANAANQHPVVLTEKYDLAWQYDLLSDAPVTANPIAWANSAAASLLTADAVTALLGVNLAGAQTNPAVVAYTAPDGTVYVTLKSDGLPLLVPIRAVAAAIGQATGETINTPVADALEPALRILTNIGYSDVVTPADLAPGGAYAESGYSAYDRTLTLAHQAALFGSQTLTRAEMARLPGDLITALGAGAGNELNDVLTTGAARLADALDVDLDAGQQAALGQLLTAPGTAMSQLGKTVGDDVTQVLSAVESKLPEAPAPISQEKLAELQRSVGKTLKSLRDGFDDPSQSLALKSARTDRKTPVKDAVKQVRAEVKKVAAKVKAALKPNRQADSAE